MGRPAGSANLKTREIAMRAANDGGITPLEYMLDVLRDEATPPAERMDAAKSAAPYIHARLQAIEMDNKHSGAIQWIGPKPLTNAEWEAKHGERAQVGVDAGGGHIGTGQPDPDINDAGD